MAVLEANLTPCHVARLPLALSAGHPTQTL